jgi:thiol-disulfide isomerase/thioredoxin
MKKNHLLLVVLSVSVLLFSCNSFKGYKISGTVENADAMKVYLEDITETAPVIIDTARVKDKSFVIKNYSKDGIYRLRFGEDQNNAVFLYLQSKDKITLKADFNELSQYEVTGSRASGSLQKFMLASKVQFNELDSSYYRYKNAVPGQTDSLEKVFTGVKDNYVKFVKEFIEKEENNDVACFALNFLGPMLQEEIPYLIDITDKLHKASPDSKYITNWYNSMQQYREAMLAETQTGIAENTQAPNIVIANPNGDTIQLKDLQGKYVLLDFWASWCQPCRMENPNVVKVYHKFKAKGFDIFSVSLDANADQWKKAILKDGLVWKNHGCDFGGWQSAAAQLYGVNSIPATFLLDKSGKVIAKNLRAGQLEEKLNQLFSEN